MKALPVLLLVGLVGCGPAMKQNAAPLAAPGTYVITAEQIEKSGANTAWQVLKQNAPILTIREDQNGRPQSMGRRGRSSFVLSEAPIIVLDGVRGPDFRSLDVIDAQSIFTILIYDGVEGTTYYGTDAVSEGRADARNRSYGAVSENCQKRGHLVAPPVVVLGWPA